MERMSDMKELGEVITAIVTPFDDRLEIDYGKAAALAEKLVSEGSDGIVVAGTTGESPTLTKDEKLKLFRTVKERLGGKGSVIAGTGSYCTKSTVELSRAAQEIGVDALLVVAPYYNKPPQEGLYEHFSQVAKAVTIPIILYNIPGRTGVNISTETLERLRGDHPNIVAVKDATGSLDQCSEVSLRLRAVSGASSLVSAAHGGSQNAHNPGAGFRIYSGDDSLTLPMLACGGAGVISVTSHIAGKRMKDMIMSFFRGEIQEAKRLHLELFPLFKGLFATTSPILIKEALDITGFNVGGLRPPLVRATKDQREKLAKIMKETGV
jgi:4-hydroxy-tetrahydrodipicolinate synthase